MTKQNTLWIILDLVFLIVFNAVFFVLGGTEHNASVWISYAFIHFAYLMLLLTQKLIRAGKSSAVFGFSLYSISAAYFLVGFVTGVIIILIAPESYRGAFLVQLCIAGIYGVMLISHILANEKTAGVEEKRQHQNLYVKDASAKIKGLLEKVSDKEVKKKIERLYDALYSSPVKSHNSLAQMENSILISIIEIESAVSVGNKARIVSLANAVLAAVNERNIRLKALN